MDNNVGKKYGKFTVLSLDRKSNNHKWYLCRCDCGNTKTVRLDAIKSGKTISCGCVRKQTAGRYEHKNQKHGLRNTKTYSEWNSMKQRCSKSSKKSHRYYDREIKVCDEWLNDFKAFYDHVSKLEHFEEEGYTLDRIDNNGNYEPNNVRWATYKQQALNKENTLRVEYMGREQTLMEWCEELGLNYGMVRARHLRGWKVPMLFSEKHKNQYC